MKKLLFILSVLPLACGSEPLKTELKAREEIIVPQTLETSFENNVSEYGIVYLEMTDESSISGVDKISVFEDRIYILDNYNGGRLLLFDKHGKFIKTIHRRGRAGNEYIGLNNFQIDYSNRDLLLWDENGGKILILGMDGEYKYTVKLESKPSGIVRLKNGNFVLGYDISRLNTNENYALAICSANGDVLSRHIKNEVYLPFGFIAPYALSECADGNISFMPQFNNTVYSVTQQEEVIPMWNVQFAPGALTISDIAVCKITDPLKFLEFKKNKNYMTGDHADNDSLLCMYNKGLFDLELIIYNKISKETKRVRNPLWGNCLTADENGYFWGVVNRSALENSDTQSELTCELKKSVQNADTYPLIYYKLK